MHIFFYPQTCIQIIFCQSFKFLPCQSNKDIFMVFVGTSARHYSWILIEEV
jgi:hypothetical protein